MKGALQVEGVFNLGEQEDKEIQSAINLALVQQRVDNLEKWKCGYEEAQNQRWNNFEQKMDKFVDNLTAQMTSMTTKLNDQKDNWMSKPPYWVTAMFSALVGLVVYLITK